MSFCFVLHEARVGHFFFMELLIGHSLRWRPLWLSHFVFFILLRSSSHLWSILVGSLSCTDLAIKQNVAFYKKDWNLFSFFNQKEVCNLWSLLDCERGGRALWRSDAFSFLPDSSFGFSICIQIVFSWGELLKGNELFSAHPTTLGWWINFGYIEWTSHQKNSLNVTNNCSNWHWRVWYLEWASNAVSISWHSWQCRTSALYAVLVLLSLWTVVPMFVHFQFVCHIFPIRMAIPSGNKMWLAGKSRFSSMIFPWKSSKII